MVSTDNDTFVDKDSVVDGLCYLEGGELIGSRVYNLMARNSFLFDTRLKYAVLDTVVTRQQANINFCLLKNSNIPAVHLFKSFIRDIDEFTTEALPDVVSETLLVRDIYPCIRLTGLPRPITEVLVYADIKERADRIRIRTDKSCWEAKLNAKDSTIIRLERKGLDRGKAEAIVAAIQSLLKTYTPTPNNEHRVRCKEQLLDIPVWEIVTDHCHPASFTDEKLADKVNAILARHPIFDKERTSKYLDSI